MCYCVIIKKLIKNDFKQENEEVSYKVMFNSSVQHFENPQFFNLSCFKIYTTTLCLCQLVKSMLFVQRTGT